MNVSRKPNPSSPFASLEAEIAKAQERAGREGINNISDREYTAAMFGFLAWVIRSKENPPVGSPAWIGAVLKAAGPWGIIVALMIVVIDQTSLGGALLRLLP